MSQEDLRETPAVNGTNLVGNGATINGNAALGHSGERSISEASTLNAGTRRPERIQSGKSKKEHHHHRSQSRHHHHPQELKTVGEYALHHLFNSVSK